MNEERTTPDPAGTRRPASPRPARREVPRGRRLAVGIAAAVLTLGSAAAAVALNLGASDPATGSPAGKLVATTLAEPATTATPSTIVVDVTVPDLPPGSIPRADAPVPASGATTATNAPAAPSTNRSGEDDRGTEVGDDHGGDRSEREGDDHGEHHDGADDDD